MYFIRPFLYSIVNVFLRFNQCYSTKCIGYNTNCVGVAMKPYQMCTNTVCIVTNALRKVTLTKSQRNVDNISKKQSNSIVIHS